MVRAMAEHADATIAHPNAPQFIDEVSRGLLAASYGMFASHEQRRVAASILDVPIRSGFVGELVDAVLRTNVFALDLMELYVTFPSREMRTNLDSTLRQGAAV
eukprot:EC725663.1.p2 GENE.EC725663.1~~EC725663.1.p2  ORF type:complete len:103 (-),score=14.23 EC725663.1:173-481(-)